MTIKQKLRTGEIKMGKYAVGLPVISDSYKAKTPRIIKIIGNISLFIGGTVSTVAGFCTLPGWLAAAGGIAALVGKFVAESFRNNE